MNTLMTSAKVSTIRDRQLDERKQMDDTDRNKEKRLDLMMEMVIYLVYFKKDERTRFYLVLSFYLV